MNTSMQRPEAHDYSSKDAAIRATGATHIGQGVEGGKPVSYLYGRNALGAYRRALFQAHGLWHLGREEQINELPPTARPVSETRPQRRALARLHRTKADGRPTPRAATAAAPSSMPRLDSFTRSYAEAALWSSTDESDESGGKPMDENYTIFDIAPETMQEMVEDCAAFQEQNAELLSESGIEDGRAGFCFWLSRNGHGSGFFDEDTIEKQFRDQLQEAARQWGEYDLYIGDDGQVYGSGPLRHRQAKPAASAGRRETDDTQRRKIGERMSPWGSDFSYGEGSGSVGAVASYYSIGKVYPDAKVVATAIAAIEADIPKAERGESGWTKKDAADLRGIAHGLRYYYQLDYGQEPDANAEAGQQFEVVVSDGRTIAHITAPDAESANLDLARGKRGGWYPADAKIKGYQGRFAAARKRAAPRRDEREDLLQGAGGAGESYAHDQVLSMDDFIWDQMIEAEAMRKRDPSSVLPLETKADYRKLARNMLQQLRWDTKRDLDHDMILKMAGADEGLPAGVTERDVVSAFYEGFDRELKSDEKVNYLAEEIEHIHGELRSYKSVEEARKSKRGARQGDEGGIRSYGPGKFGWLIDSYAYGLSMDGVDEEAGTTDTGGWYGLIWLDAAARKAITKLAADDEKPLNAEESKLLAESAAVIFFERTDGIVETEWQDSREEAQKTWDGIVREVERSEGEGNGNGDDDFDLQTEMETGMVIGDSRSGYSVSLEGKHLEDFKDYDEALKFAAQKMEDDSYWPNVFHVNDRGNTDLLSLKVKKNKKGKVTSVDSEIVRSWV